MSEEEKKALAFLRFYVSDDEDEYFDRDYCIDKNIIETILNLISKQQDKINYLEDLISTMEEYYSITVEDLENCIKKDK